jgi:outer membrane autotransporter protein
MAVVKTTALTLTFSLFMAAVVSPVTHAQQAINGSGAIDANGQANGILFNGNHSLLVTGGQDIGETAGYSINTNGTNQGSVSFNFGSITTSTISGDIGASGENLVQLTAFGAAVGNLVLGGTSSYIDQLRIDQQNVLLSGGGTHNITDVISLTNSQGTLSVGNASSASIFNFSQIGTGPATLAAVTFTGAVTVNAGGAGIYASTLLVNSGVNGSTANATTLGTNLTLNGNLEIDNSGGQTGHLNLGTNTLTVTGTTTADVGTKITVGVSGAGAGKISSTTGGATIDIGVLIAVDVQNAPLANGATYAIVQGITPITVPTASVTDNSIFWSFVASQSGNNLILTANQEAGLGSLTSGTVASGAGAELDNIFLGTPSTGMASIMTLFNNMSSQTEVTAAVTETSPTVNGAIQTASLNLINQNFGTIENRVTAMRRAGKATGLSAGSPPSTKAVWGQIFGSSSDQEQEDGVDGYNATTFGLALGGDGLISPEYRVGLALSYGHSNVDSTGASTGNKTDIDSFQLTAYGSLEDNSPWLVDGAATFALNKYENTRDITFASVQAKGEFDGYQAGARLNVGYEIVNNGFNLVPKALAQYTYLHQQSYTETGAGALNLKVDADNIHSFTTGLGLSVNKVFVGTTWTTKPELSAMWLYDWADTRIESTAAFASDGGKFLTNGADRARNSGKVGVGLNLENNDGLALFAGYEGEFRDNYLSHNGRVQARINF